MATDKYTGDRKEGQKPGSMFKITAAKEEFKKQIISGLKTKNKKRIANKMVKEKFTARLDEETFNKMTSNRLSNPAYVFSNQSNAQEFYNKAYKKGKKTNHSLLESGIKKYDTKIDAIVKPYENKMAERLCYMLSIPTNGDARLAFKQWYYNILKNGNITNDLIQSAIQAVEVTSEELMVAALGSYYTGPDNSSDESVSKYNAQQNRMRKNSNTAVKNLEFLKKRLSADELPFLHQVVLEPQKFLEGVTLSDPASVVSIQKGYLHELTVGAIFSALFEANAINKEVNSKFPVKIEGTLNRTDIQNALKASVTDGIVNFASFTGLVADTTGGRGSDGVITTDISMDLPPVGIYKDKAIFNIDVKSTVGNKYLTNKTSIVPILPPAIKINLPEVNAAIMTILNTGALTNKNMATKYFLESPAFFSLIIAVAESDYFLQNILDLDAIQSGTFQHMIVVEDKVYWYSELLKGYIRNYVYNEKGGFLSHKSVSLINTESLQESSAKNSREINSIKLALLKRLDRQLKRKHTYAEGYNFLMQNKTAKVKNHSQSLDSMLNDYHNRLQSVSLRFDLSIKITDIL